MDRAKSWGGVSTCNTGTEHRSRISVTSKELHFYTAFTAQEVFQVWKGANGAHIWAGNAGTWRKQKGSGLRRWICFILQSKPWLYTKRDWMCPDMLCVWVPLFITSNTSPSHCQYSASSPMQLNSVTATGALSPGAIASDLLSSCILSHSGAHRLPHCCPVTRCLAIFVILCKAAPVRWYLLSIHQRNALICFCLDSASATTRKMSVMRQNQ